MSFLDAGISRPLSSSPSHKNVSFESFDFGGKTVEDVKRWYNNLKDKQIPTEFLSILYMKDQGTTFEHEFLLIHLLNRDTLKKPQNDGADLTVTSAEMGVLDMMPGTSSAGPPTAISNRPRDQNTPQETYICRVERTGNGSRSQALSTAGDLAHDTVRIFSKGAYAEIQSSRTSRRVLEIQFLERLDLLRILELCHAMQENIAARYTLLRFNCYFLCWTVLINLMRGINTWDNRIDIDMWGRLMEQLPELIKTWVKQNLDNPPSFPTPNPPTKTKTPSSSKSNFHRIAWYLCFRGPATILDSDGSRVIGTIIDSIRAKLDPARDQLLDSLNSHNSTTFHSTTTQLRKSVNQGLLKPLSTIVNEALERQQVEWPGQKLGSLLSDNSLVSGDSPDDFPLRPQAKVVKTLHKQWIKYMWEYLRSDEFWLTPTSANLNEPSLGEKILDLVPLLPEVRVWRMSYKYAIGDILGSCPNSYLNFKHFGFYRNQILPVVLSDRTNVQIASEKIRQDYRTLAIHTLLQLEPANQSEKLDDQRAWMKRCFRTEDWSYCLHRCVSGMIYDHLVSLEKEPLLRVKVVLQNDTEVQNNSCQWDTWGYTELCAFVSKRIEAHANKVALELTDTSATGPSRAIQYEIHGAIQDIWCTAKQNDFS